MPVLVVDFGSQFTQLIARRLRELKFEVEVLNHAVIDPADLEKFEAIIISGSGKSVSDLSAADVAILEGIIAINGVKAVPVLGICFGFHLLCRIMGGYISFAKGSGSEFGRGEVVVCGKSELFKGLPDNFSVWLSHGDSVPSAVQLEGFNVIAKSRNGNVAAVANEERKIYGVQFHPEVTHTPQGKLMLENFVGLSRCERNWSLDLYKKQIFEQITETVGSEQVIAAVSGGVDSTVAALMLHQVVGDNLYCFLIDHGLLRKNEVECVRDVYAYMGIKLHVFDESKKFIGALAGVTDPEMKRKIIGRLFIECFECRAKSLCNAKFLMQGTLAPDVIESGAGGAYSIKSHHNVGGLPEAMNLKLIEPLKGLFKDEVRKLGLELGLKEEFVFRHPFPGPGLAVRIPGAITVEKLRIIREVDDIYITLMKERGFYSAVWQAFAILLPVRSVGVMGDSRTYEYSCALRAVNSEDAMSAEVFPFADRDQQIPFWEFLKEVGTKIVNSVQGVNRVLYDITSKPPGTIEWE